MSEQTPNSPEGLRGAEPSMEDILASIRKIISDDEPVAMESPEDIPTVDLVEAHKTDELDDLMQGIHMNSSDLRSDAVLDAEVAEAESFAAEGDSVDLNIEDVLAGLDDDILESEEETVSLAALEQTAAEDALSSVFDDLEANIVSPDSLASTLEAAPLDNVIPEADDDILAFLDADIPLVSEPTASLAKVAPIAAAGIIPAIAAVKMAAPEREKTMADDDLEMDALLDDILLNSPESDDEFEVEDLLDSEPVEADFMSELSAADVPETEEMSDLDLVKSLMADLADDPDGLEADEDLDALLAIPEVEGEAEIDELVSGFADHEPEATAASDVELEDDIMGDIVDMTIEDELQSHPDDIEVPDDIEMMNAEADDLTSLDEILGAEQHNIAENALPVEDLAFDDLSSEDLPVEDTQADDFLSLSEIAASAEADAVAVETAFAPQAIAATAGLAAVVGGGALGAAALGETSQAETEIDDTPAEADIQIEIAEAYSEPTAKPILESHPTQETSMPVQAVKTDAILDDVTETATAGAFAELNQVVEDKAIFSERGPRIGDLVQDALRPMLKEWLDANLKGIVERAVTKEVKRISSGK